MNSQGIAIPVYELNIEKNGKRDGKVEAKKKERNLCIKM